ncbi:hypothetical protein AVEN_180667-1 [Araneus ventricosus]|uniref:Uncharacterized protein n=1 Tax=Araneus ventricosus TaxID=182803 RepID=A0A4Y2VRW7_ARAVE|nr:hypothetical protein AVEN_180667-1 [Araneus ventricosus]
MDLYPPSVDARSRPQWLKLDMGRILAPLDCAPSRVAGYPHAQRGKRLILFTFGKIFCCRRDTFKIDKVLQPLAFRIALEETEPLSRRLGPTCHARS